MNKLFLLSVLICGVLLLTICTQSAMSNRKHSPTAKTQKKKANNYDAWVLSQSHQIYGPQKVYLTKSWLMTENLREGSTYVKKLGQQNLVAYNRKKKVYYIGTSLSIMKRMTLLSTLSDTSLSKMKGAKRQWKLSKKDNLFGFPCEVYTLYYENRKWKLWITKNLGIDKAVYKDLLDWTKIPDLNGMPLRLVFYGSSGKATAILNTQSIEKTTVSEEKLHIPEGSKQVKEIFQISSGRTEQLMESFSEILGD